MKKNGIKKYRRRNSLRKLGWDYRSDGAYFITICTKNRGRFFGRVVAGEMQLSPMGWIAHQYWNEIPQHTQNCALGEFVVMPDHIHGILILKNGRMNFNPQGRCMQRPCRLQRLENRNVPPINNNPIGTKDHFKSEISPKAHSISVIVRSYKSAVTRQANMLGYRFGWQGKFHDSIIRDGISFFRVGRYIKNNPKKWSLDGKN
jgi:REP element-mobilizing transposase RayT